MPRYQLKSLFQRLTRATASASCALTGAWTLSPWVSALGLWIPAIRSSLLERVRAATRVVAIDEAQFFDARLVDHVQRLLRQNRQVYVSGLDRDYRGQPFGPMPQLLAIADSVIKLTAVCAGCCSDTATMTHRRTPQTEQVVLGAAEMAAPMCRVCYNAATWITQRTRSWPASGPTWLRSIAPRLRCT
jgi:hypothetical protein